MATDLSAGDLDPAAPPSAASPPGAGLLPAAADGRVAAPVGTPGPAPGPVVPPTRRGGTPTARARRLGPGAWALVAVVAAGAVLRFTTGSHLWLDEALTVEIARRPLGGLFHALRHDGAPPLYYLILHVWIKVFGDG
ncbi:MAG TPA: hypothetical protein VKP11_03310, partial [Frankiaceae bacterium]|nr:hypothetical protein [Frankiaceae bacterium]